ncbi:MAG: hypothetical protein IT355_14770 [Gemmatimonadaceae bacterium]|nr:hypothetical protein [Gemmatimonadaceae bacterium]
MSGLAVRVVCVAIVSALGLPRLGAQAAGSAVPVPAVPHEASVVVAGMFVISPEAPVLVQTPQQGLLCTPGACYTGGVIVRANQRWQVQVRLRPTAPGTFTAAWLSPSQRQPLALGPQFTTIATGLLPSPSTPLSLTFHAANRASRTGGVVPSAAQLSASLEFRVVALP